jgi:hypothetical protein
MLIESCLAGVFVTANLFQPNLKFVGKAGAYESEAPFRCHNLGYAHGIHANIRLV